MSLSKNSSEKSRSTWRKSKSSKLNRLRSKPRSKSKRNRLKSWNKRSWIMRTKCSNIFIILKDSISRMKKAWGISCRRRRKVLKSLKGVRCFISRNMRKKRHCYSRKSNSTRTNSKNNPKRRSTTTQSSETSRRNTPSRSKKCSVVMSSKTRSSNLRSMNSKIMRKNLRTTTKTRRKSYLACNKILMLRNCISISWRKNQTLLFLSSKNN